MYLCDYYCNFKRHHLIVCGDSLVREVKYDLLVVGSQVPGKIEVYNGVIFVLFSFISSSFIIDEYELRVESYND